MSFPPLLDAEILSWTDLVERTHLGLGVCGHEADPTGTGFSQYSKSKEWDTLRKDILWLLLRSLHGNVCEIFTSRESLGSPMGPRGKSLPTPKGPKGMSIPMGFGH